MIRYVRYGEALLIGCAYEEDASIVLEMVKNLLDTEIGIQLNLQRTCIRQLSKFGNESIDFLGYKIKTTNGHIRLSIKDFSKTCSEIRTGCRKILYKMMMGKEKNIHELNSFLSSYINYYDICTNLEPLISYCNKILYNIGYKKLKVLDKLPNEDIYTIKRPFNGRKSTINLYDLRKNTSLSYKNYVSVPYWKPNSVNEFAWVNQITKYNESFKSIYLHGLLLKYPIDFITGTDFREILHIDIHHKISVSMGGSDEFDNLIPLSTYSRRLVNCSKSTIKKYYNPIFKHNLTKLNKLRKLANNEPINANDIK